MTAHDLVLEFEGEARALLQDAPDGAGLDDVSRALIRLGVSVSVTSLDEGTIEEATASAFEAGASIAQIQEVVALVSGLGVHSIMASARGVLREAAERGLADPLAPLDAEQQLLWDRFVGDDPYWNGFSGHFPGFLDAMLRLSPDLFAGFFAYCAIPWKSGTVSAVTKELAAMASDIMPTHLFVPGFRLHLANAIKLGASRSMVLEAIGIAKEASPTSIIHR